MSKYRDVAVRNTDKLDFEKTCKKYSDPLFIIEFSYNWMGSSELLKVDVTGEKNHYFHRSIIFSWNDHRLGICSRQDQRPLWVRMQCYQLFELFFYIGGKFWVLKFIFVHRNLYVKSILAFFQSLKITKCPNLGNFLPLQNCLSNGFTV